jgi:hypothetical protein
LSVNSNSNIAQLKVIHNDANYIAVSIEDVKGGSSVFILSNSNASAAKQHQLQIDGKSYSWKGPFHYADNQ